MWRLLAFIVVCVLSLVFMVFNLENKSDISFGFLKLNDIPVFLTAFSAFVLGMLFAAPFALFFHTKRKKPSHGQLDDSFPQPEEKQLAAPKKQRRTKNRKKQSSAGSIERDRTSPPDEVKKEHSPYGID